MATILERISTITDKAQITLPKDVRQALGVSRGDRITWRVEDSKVSVHRADEQDVEFDPVLGEFLSFVAKDMKNRPQSIAALTPALVARIAGLIEGVTFDPDEEIEGDVAL